MLHNLEQIANLRPSEVLFALIIVKKHSFKEG
jgi:hypothetical protein